MKPVYRTRFPSIRCYNTDQTRQNVLSLMRKSAQPVTVITTVLPATESKEPAYHGATLSSFTSVSMHPHPLVAFSLRTPSRMADLLQGVGARTQPHPHMVINLLSASQARLALQFSRPHEYRDPFASTAYFLSHEGIPILRGCVGALSCTLVGSWPLGDINPSSASENTDAQIPRGPGEQGSELFLARVLRVESGSSEEGEGDALPLVYYRQQYVTVQDGISLPLPGTVASNTRTP